MLCKYLEFETEYKFDYKMKILTRRAPCQTDQSGADLKN
jgi:hypothetical protein